MDIKIFVYDIEKICRTCLKQQNEMISVFENDSELGENVQISEIIKNLTSMEVSLLYFNIISNISLMYIL